MSIDLHLHGVFADFIQTFCVFRIDHDGNGFGNSTAGFCTVSAQIHLRIDIGRPELTEFVHRSADGYKQIVFFNLITDIRRTRNLDIGNQHIHSLNGIIHFHINLYFRNVLAMNVPSAGCSVTVRP